MKVILRSIVFLAIFFVMLYVGMNNPQSIDFYFPVAFEKKVNASAALIYFGVFAVGVLAGTVITAGGGGKRSSKSKD